MELPILQMDTCSRDQVMRDIIFGGVVNLQIKLCIFVLSTSPCIGHKSLYRVHVRCIGLFGYESLHVLSMSPCISYESLYRV